MKATAISKEQKSLVKSSFPKTLSNNFERRIEILDGAKTNIELQNQLVDVCKRDIVFFFNYFLWTFNPKVEPNHFPFVLYPRQRELARSFLEEVKDGKGSLTEKSRETGLTYIVLGVYLHQFLFNPGFEALLLSYREDEVDNWTPSSMFGKLRYMIDRLPFWLRPFKFDRRYNSKFLMLYNPDNENSIIGQATTEDAGRSGRKKAVLIDEYASINVRLVRGLEVALQETTNCIHRVSTPKGINQFKAIRDKGIVRVHTIHWTMIPNKVNGLYYMTKQGKRINCPDLHAKQISKYGFYITPEGRTTKFRLRSKWYDAKCKDYLHARDRAQELDINYLGSGYCRFNTEMIEINSARVTDGVRGYLVNEGTMEDPDIKFVEVDEGAPFELEIWKFPTEPHYNNRTTIGADVAEGLEKGDYSCADVLENNLAGTQAEHVAALHGHFAPDVFAEKLFMLGHFYDGGCELAVERNKDGLGVLLNLKDTYEYLNLFKATDDKRDGFLTKQANKFTITGDLDQALKDGELKTQSINHYTELSTFENNNGKLGATGENFDDRVMGMAIGWHCVRQYGRPKEKDIMKHKRKKIKRFDTTKY